MPATVNVNMLTVVHASSTGVAMSFPDVCKTPTPAGPVPIPYPNVAQSSDTADGSSTVKIDGNPIMLKSSNFRMSTGDEAGSAMGVVSNKIKGKAIPVNASFDVKVDGKNVFRLTDPMQTNCGSPSNAINMALVQPPLPPAMVLSDECKAVKKKKQEQGEEIACKNSGMYPPHFDAIKKVAEDFDVIFYFRQTNELCIPWIEESHQPKPHRVFKANTIKTHLMVREVDAWLRTHPAKTNAFAHPMQTNKTYCTNAAMYKGVVGELETAGERKPLKAVGTGPQLSGKSYKGKWITADYDLFQVLRNTPGCEEVGQKSQAFSNIKRAIAEGCQWDAIQHGPQAQWVPTEHEKEKHGAPDVNFPAALGQALKSKNPEKKIEIPGRNPMKVVDDSVTVIAPAGAVFLEKPEDTLEALICSECDGKE